MKTTILTLFMFVAICTAKAAELLVPSQYATIQEAIVAASPGDVIIVSNGIYVENLDFLGKAITVTSNFHTTGNVNDILNTIIDGSQPIDTDFGSCVRFANNETETSVLKGFTITGGSGTKTYNPAENRYFRTGGGILIDHASPTIIHNIIRNNACVAESGVFGAGGGGIRMGFGQPVIENNVIKNNLGGYAGGIMIAYCGGTVLRNNLIAYNLATGSFNGGGGVYVDWEPITLENNTIVKNHSDDKGGGIISTGTSTVIVNCIIYGNTATNGFPQIFKRFGGGNATLTYTAIEGGFDGTGDEEGMITDDPLFEDTNSFYLTPSSPCIDTGNPDPQYNDVEDPSNPGNALFPAMGTLRNDMGAYGGQGSAVILGIPEHEVDPERIRVQYVNPYNNEGLYIISKEVAHINLQYISIDGKILFQKQDLPLNPGKNLIPLEISTSGLLRITPTKGAPIILKLIKK
ncbi:right-handed parallel beta-helix repeat-containing protein [Aequorivita todarodis]|uniref:right-handed parallel beta-helix repeat-containing protein n=1 Tax=Aequorivita todarodis TaxID=2036821 RepID=UPI002350E7E3|nr:right-handed parallel beta-helix repeat-containing protein [Aequorivita todarodis]MDC7999660.1 right-handed parallel beta-helix repeat-containing protein [Aequorivita todarodis]